MCSQVQYGKGFTLLELMAVVFIISIITAVAIPSVQEFTRQAARAAAQQEMLKLAEQLERHRGKNFTYRGFNATFMYNTFLTNASTLNLPLGSSGSQVQYVVKFVDLDTDKALTDAAATGLNWAITAEKTSSNMQSKNYDLLLTSTGIRCMTKVTSAEVAAHTGCGGQSESW